MKLNFAHPARIRIVLTNTRENHPSNRLHSSTHEYSPHVFEKILVYERIFAPRFRDTFRPRTNIRPCFRESIRPRTNIRPCFRENIRPRTGIRPCFRENIRPRTNIRPMCSRKYSSMDKYSNIRPTFLRGYSSTDAYSPHKPNLKPSNTNIYLYSYSRGVCNFASCVVHQTHSLGVLILYFIPGIYRAHACSFWPFFFSSDFCTNIICTRTDYCPLLYLNLSTYEYYWCCCTYRVVPYDPFLVVALFVASLSRSCC